MLQNCRSTTRLVFCAFEDALRADDFELLNRGPAASCNDIQALAKRAQAAGWLPEEIATATVSLGERYVETRSPTASVDSTTGKAA